MMIVRISLLATAARTRETTREAAKAADKVDMVYQDRIIVTGLLRGKTSLI